MSFDFYYGSKYQYSSKFKHPEVIAKQIATRSKLQEGYNLALKEEKNNAINAFKEAQNLIPGIDLEQYKYVIDNDPKTAFKRIIKESTVSENSNNDSHKYLINNYLYILKEEIH